MPGTAKNTKRIAPNIMPANATSLSIGDLRRLAQNEPKSFVRKVQGLVDNGLRWKDIANTRDLYGGLCDVQVTASQFIAGMNRTIMASAFPMLAGSLTVAGVNDAFDALPTIGEQLVDDFEDSKKITHLVAIERHDNHVDRVDEGQDFPEVGASEEKFEIRHRRNGRKLTITAETIEENDIPGIVDRVNGLGEIAAEIIEKLTLRRVCDIDGSASSPAEPYVLHMGGSAISLYATANTYLPNAHSSGTRITNNALVDTTDLDAARSRLAGMKNERGERILIPINQCTLLVPDALYGVAAKLLGSELQPGVDNELNNWGPRGDWRPKLLSSPKLDDLSTTTWYLGLFQKQFRRKWKLRMEYVTLGDNTQAYLNSRIAFQARLAWDCEVGARDYVYVVQSLSGTSAPSA